VGKAIMGMTTAVQSRDERLAKARLSFYGTWQVATLSGMIGLHQIRDFSSPREVIRS
jgi:hypothetical protein